MTRERSGVLCACGCGEFTLLASKTMTSRGWRKGHPLTFIVGHHRYGRRRRLRVDQVKFGYRKLTTGKGIASVGREIASHRERAEKTLGKPLPLGAVVHHADGTKRDDAPLVICQDNAYHHLLHFRMRVKSAGGDPNNDLMCSSCKRPKPKTDFQKNRAHRYGYNPNCRACESARHRAQKERKRGAA